MKHGAPTHAMVSRFRTELGTNAAINQHDGVYLGSGGVSHGGFQCTLLGSSSGQ